jgi:outer membrane protein OmpA-like peptidoglycan-associated protein
MATKCPKCKPTECEECPEWIFTLADLIMCMMGLFVILWVLKPEGAKVSGNTKDNTEMVKMAAAIRDAFGYVPDPKSLDPVDMELIAQKMKGERVPRGPGEGGKTQLDHQGNEGEDPLVTKIREGAQSAVGSSLMFESGSAKVSAESVKEIRKIAGQIRGHQNIVVVKGHASLDDNVSGQVGSGIERARRELSAARAEAVAEVLMAEGVSAEVIRVQGCSVWEPVRQRRFDGNAQAANRRVEIEVSDQLVKDRQDQTRREAGPTAVPAPTVVPGGRE